jgi:F-type H+-transporting ATPase subunit gamma
MIGIKEFNKKIVSLKNTRKMTKTMKMVSASKFKRAHKAQSAALDYSQRLTALMARLASSAQGQHPLMKPKKTVKNALIVLFTSDKGLAGGFNNNLIRAIRRFTAENSGHFAKYELSFLGRRGYMAFRRSAAIKKYYENITIKPTFKDALTVSHDLAEGFLKNEYDEVFLAYNRFVSAISQVPTIERILPLSTEGIAQAKTAKTPQADYLYEPEEAELFSFLVPKFMDFKVYFTLLENAAGEHAARMSAMDKASSNTGDLIDKYTLLRNRARQASITTELIEIISGAEALK